MEQSHKNLKERFAFFTWALLLILLIIIGTLILERAENKRFRENQKRSIVEQISTIRARLEGELNKELLLARSMTIEVATNPSITRERFFTMARHFLTESKHIKNIGLAKGTVLTYVFPVKGNEKAIGLDYKKNIAQWPAVSRVIAERKTVVAGPLNLVQGGVAIIGRTPIYIGTDSDKSNPGTYFGLLSVVIKIPSLLADAGLNEVADRLSLAIRGKDGLGAKGDLFFGSADTFRKDPVITRVNLPGGSWQMAAVPVNGWQMRSPQIIYYRIVALMVGSLILYLLFIQRREMNYRRQAELGREKLIVELQAALSEVKQLSGLLPICSHCKKVRDDKGYWNQIDAYIQEHSEADISHSICPACAVKYYPDLEIYAN